MFTVKLNRVISLTSVLLVSCFHGATEPGMEKFISSPSTCNSDTYVILISATHPGGKFPTLTVKTS